MKLHFFCLKCVEGKIPEWATLPLQESNIYRFTCSAGHSQTVILDQKTYEILFEVAIQAIKDGYYRDAVSSFADSLERFYEFYFFVVSAEHNNLEAAKLLWKAVSKQSERQLGLFIGTYFSEKQTLPTLLSQKHIEFRNTVVHRGLIPTMEQAIRFGQEVADIIMPQIVEMRKLYASGIGTVGGVHAIGQVKENEKFSFYSYPLPIDITGTETSINIEEIINRRKGRDSVTVRIRST